DNLGLIGELDSGGIVRGVGILNVQINNGGMGLGGNLGGGPVGALVGLNLGGTIIYTFAAGTGSSLNPILVPIPAADPGVTAVLKYQNPGTPGVAIAGNSSVGGLVGLNAGLIVNSHASVSVYGLTDVGG